MTEHDPPPAWQPPAAPPPGAWQPPPPPAPGAWQPPPPEGPPGWVPAPPAPPGRRPVARILGVIGVFVVGLVAVLFLVGRNSGPVGSNGESQKSASDILNDGASAFANARYVHLTGNGSNGSETDVYDLHISNDGTDGVLTADNVAANVVVLGNDLYLRGPEFFAKFAGADAAAVIGDRWVHLKADDPRFSKYVKVLTQSGLKDLFSSLAAKIAPGKGGSTMLAGKLVLPLHASDGEVDIALDGKPYPLRLQFDDPGNKADLRFGDYDLPTTPPQRPTNVLDLPPGA